MERRTFTLVPCRLRSKWLPLSKRGEGGHKRDLSLRLLLSVELEGMTPPGTRGGPMGAVVFVGFVIVGVYETVV